MSNDSVKRVIELEAEVGHFKAICIKIHEESYQIICAKDEEITQLREQIALLEKQNIRLREATD
jgi:hypothetical protein